MNAIRLPVILLIIVLVLSAFYYRFNASNRPIIKDLDSDNKAEMKKSEEEDKLAKAGQKLEDAIGAFNKKNYKLAYDLLQGYSQGDDYDLVKVRAYSLAAMGRDTDAILEFEKLMNIKKVPENAFALAYVYEKAGFLDTAHKTYEELSQAKLASTLEVDILEGLVRTLAYESDEKKRFQKVQRLVKLSPSSELGAVAFAKICSELTNDKRPQQFIEKLWEIHKKSYEYNYWAGIYSLNNGFVSFAIKLFNNCIALAPENSGAYFYAFKAEKENGNNAKALALLEKYRSMTSVQVASKTIYEAAREAYKLKKLKLAYELYRSAVSADRSILANDDSDLLKDVETRLVPMLSPEERAFHQVFKRYLDGQYDLALEQMQKLHPSLEQPLKFDGFNLMRECKSVKRQDNQYLQYLADLEQAKIDEELAKKLEKKLAAEEEAFAKLVEQLPDESLLDAIKRNAMLDPTNYASQYNAAVSLSENGFYQESVLFFELAQRLEPSNHEPAFSLAKLNFLQGNPFSTGQNIKRALELAPSDTSVLTLAAEIELSKNNPDSALAYAQKALKANVNNYDAKAMLAQAHAQRGEVQEAKALIEQALAAKNMDAALRKRLTDLKGSLHNR